MSSCQHDQHAKRGQKAQHARGIILKVQDGDYAENNPRCTDAKRLHWWIMSAFQDTDQSGDTVQKTMGGTDCEWYFGSDFLGLDPHQPVGDVWGALDYEMMAELRDLLQVTLRDVNGLHISNGLARQLGKEAAEKLRKYTTISFYQLRDMGATLKFNFPDRYEVRRRGDTVDRGRSMAV